MSFWDNADRVVEEAGTSYSWVCTQTGVAESTLSTQRKHKTDPKISFVVRFARLMGVSIESLLDLPGPAVIPQRLERLMADARVLSDDDLETAECLVSSLITRRGKKRTMDEGFTMGSAV